MYGIGGHVVTEISNIAGKAMALILSCADSHPGPRIPATLALNSDFSVSSGDVQIEGVSYKFIALLSDNFWKLRIFRKNAPRK